MRAADIDYVCVASDAVIQMVEVDRDGRLAFREQSLQLLHRYCVVLGVVECEVADLKNSLGCERIDIARRTLSVMSARSSKYSIAFAMLTPECFFLRR
jgi:hypothetical protein